MDGELGADGGTATENYQTATDSGQSSAFQSCESLNRVEATGVEGCNNVNGEATIDGEKSAGNVTEEELDGAVAGGDPNVIVDPTTGSTALHLACQDVDLPQVKKLIEDKGASVHRTNSKERTMIHELVMGYAQLSVLDRVYEQNNFIEILMLLVRGGVDVNEVDLDNRTALHYLVTLPRSTERLAEALKALLMSGARVNMADNVQQTALHMAALKGDCATLETLVELGADVNARDATGQTPLHLVAKGRSSKHRAVIAKLASCGANVNEQDMGRRTPLHIAVKGRRLENALELLRYGSRWDMRDAAGNTCLHLAAVHDPSGRMLEALLNTKDYRNVALDLNVKDFVYEETVLHKIVRLKMVDNFKILCQHRPDPNLKDVSGETPLHKASHIPDILFWNSLLRLGGDVNIPSHTGTTPYQKAAKAKNHVALAVMRQINVDF